MSITLYCWGRPQGFNDHGEPAEIDCRRMPFVEVSRTRFTPAVVHPECSDCRSGEPCWRALEARDVLTQATLPYCPSCLHALQHDPNIIVHRVESIWGSEVGYDRRREPRPDNPGRRQHDHDEAAVAEAVAAQTLGAIYQRPLGGQS